MKLLLLLLLICVAPVKVLGQPILTSAAGSAVAGESFCIYSCGVSSVRLGAGGPAATWDYSSLHSIGIDTITYSDAAGTADADSFPGCTLALLSNGTYEYYISNTSQFALAGETTGMGDVYFSSPKLLMPYPFTYGDTRIANYVSSRPAMQLFNRGIDTFSADAYGTLILPTGTYSNVLRIHKSTFVFDSYIVSGTAHLDSYLLQTWYWYTPGFHTPLLAMYYDIDPMGVPELAQVQYYARNTSGLPTTKLQGNDVNMYPNPANQELHIAPCWQQDERFSIRIMDITGRIVPIPDGAPLQQNGIMTINTASLPDGIHLITTSNAHHTACNRICIQH